MEVQRNTDGDTPSKCSLAGLVQAMGIVSVDQMVPRHLFFANSVFNFIIRDYSKVGSPFCVTTL